MATVHWQAYEGRADIGECNRHKSVRETTTDPYAVTCGKAACQGAARDARRQRASAERELHDGGRGVVAGTPAGSSRATLTIQGIEIAGLGIRELDAIATAAASARATLINRDPASWERAKDEEFEERAAEYAREAEADALAAIASLEAEARDLAARQ